MREMTHEPFILQIETNVEFDDESIDFRTFAHAERIVREWLSSTDIAEANWSGFERFNVSSNAKRCESAVANRETVAESRLGDQIF